MSIFDKILRKEEKADEAVEKSVEKTDKIEVEKEIG